MECNARSFCIVFVLVVSQFCELWMKSEGLRWQTTERSSGILSAGLCCAASVSRMWSPVCICIFFPPSALLSAALSRDNHNLWIQKRLWVPGEADILTAPLGIYGLPHTHWQREAMTPHVPDRVIFVCLKWEHSSEKVGDTILREVTHLLVLAVFGPQIC